MITTVLNAGVDRQQLYIGGKSMGGRMASLIADTRAPAGLVCLVILSSAGQAGKTTPEHLADLQNLDADTARRSR